MAETTYIVLRQRAADTWEDICEVTAASAEAAIRKAFNANTIDMGQPASPTTTAMTREGTYVAVPARSWKPVTVQAVQTTVLKLETAAE